MPYLRTSLENGHKEIMTSYHSGEIYFIREHDFESGTTTPFVKIGLVRYREGRDSWGRMNEHQTGNPRKLSLNKEHVVSTEAVDLVEARLHREFAKNRVLGEWFEFESYNELTEAVGRAREMADEVAPEVASFGRANAMKYQKSNSAKREPTETEISSGFELAVAKAQLSICKSLESSIGAMLTKAYSEGRDVSPYSKVVVKPFVSKFAEDEFKKSHPQLWEKFLAEERDWYSRFLLKTKINPESDLGAAFYAEIEEVHRALYSAKQQSDLSLLVEPSMSLAALRGIAEWNQKVNETRLQLAVGGYEEITGVCEWKRYEKVEVKFDSHALSIEEPELYRSFLTVGESGKKVVAKKGKI